MTVLAERGESGLQSPSEVRLDEANLSWLMTAAAMFFLVLDGTRGLPRCCGGRGWGARVVRLRI
jgi:hypothetical protein